jgi:hypothetical protein
MPPRREAVCQCTHVNQSRSLADLALRRSLRDETTSVDVDVGRGYQKGGIQAKGRSLPLEAARAISVHTRETCPSVWGTPVVFGL